MMPSITFGNFSRIAFPSAAVDHAHRVSLTRPIETDEETHCAPPGDRETLRRERSGRSLTDWRSGLARHLALHPVAGLGLSSFVSGERVSRGRRAAGRSGPPPSPRRESRGRVG